MNIKKILKNIIPKIILKYILRLKNYLVRKYHYKYNFQRTIPSTTKSYAFCFCCGKEISYFLDSWIMLDSTGSKKERYENTYSNCVCPECLSYPRHRICCHYLDNIKANIANNKVLLFGPEFSIMKWLKKNKIFYKTADLFDWSADLIIDIQDTKFNDNNWDIIICNHVLEHVPDLKRTFQELKRIVKNNGFIMITVPTDYHFDTTIEDIDNSMSIKKRIELFGQEDHLRIFGKDFSNTLTDNGFNVEIIDGNKLSKHYGTTVGPADYDDNKVYICRKIV